MEYEEIIAAIAKEVDRAEKLHPEWPPDMVHAAAIVGEESGELIRASLNCYYSKANIDEVITETIQTAATCVRLLKNIQK